MQAWGVSLVVQTGLQFDLRSAQEKLIASLRLSFTARATSPSVRFAGRRVYLSVVLMLVSPPGTSSGQSLCDLLSVPIRTLQRWRTWWRLDFTLTLFWQSVRERFMPPVVIERLPPSLLERFHASEMPDRLAQLLRFIAPLSTRATTK